MASRTAIGTIMGELLKRDELPAMRSLGSDGNFRLLDFEKQISVLFEVYKTEVMYNGQERLGLRDIASRLGYKETTTAIALDVLLTEGYLTTSVGKSVTIEPLDAGLRNSRSDVTLYSLTDKGKDAMELTRHLKQALRNIQSAMY